MPKTTKTKRVRAWAIVNKKGIECADYFTENDCCSCYESKATAVYKTKRDAQIMIFGGDNRIIPITITYSLKK